MHNIGMCTPTVCRPQQQRESEVTSRYLLAHRMGFSEVKLSSSQRMSYCLNDVKDLLYYKQQKYNSVNTLARFCVFLVFIMTFSVSMQAFSLSSYSWLRVRYDAQDYNIGLFVSCATTVAYRCADYQHTGQILILADAITQLEVCSMNSKFIRGYIGGMWTVAILQLLCETLLVLLMAYLLCYPTRSVLILWVMCLLSLSICCGIINIVLFTRFTRCYRQTCRARHEVSPFCTVRFQWAYGTYIAAIVINALCFVVALSLYSYTYSIRYRTARLLSKIRRFRCATPCERFIHDQRRAAALERPCVECESSRTRTSTMSNSFCSSVSPPSPPVSIAPRDATDVSNRAMNCVSAEAWHDTQLYKARPVGLMHGGKTCMENSLPTEIIDRRRRRKNESPTYNASTLYCLGDDNDTNDSVRNSPGILTARRIRDTFTKIFNCTNNPASLTAKELNITIDGADDWVYDDHSDMFYSFALNSFWDPLICAYYNCLTKTWYRHVSEIVDMDTLS